MRVIRQPNFSLEILGSALFKTVILLGKDRVCIVLPIVQSNNNNSLYLYSQKMHQHIVMWHLIYYCEKSRFSVGLIQWQKLVCNVFNVDVLFLGYSYILG